MKVLLVKPFSEMHVVFPPLGLGYLASYCQKVIPGIDICILDCHRLQYSIEDFKKYLLRYQPDIIGFTAFTLEISYAIKMAEAVKQVCKETIVVIGGPHASAVPESVLSYESVDYVFCGEAERGFAHFLKNFHTHERLSARGLGYRNGNNIVLNEIELIEELDNIPFPDYKKMELEKYPKMYFMQKTPSAPIISSRGCPYCCTFCAGHKVSGRLWRSRSAANIMEEIKYLYKEYRIREIDFWDDNFGLDRTRVVEFCRLFKSWGGGKVIWWCPNGLHLNSLDKDLLRIMKEVGCYAISLGIESGSETVQKDMNKNLSFTKLKEIVEYSNKIGLRTQGFFIIGYPTETEKDIMETIRLAKKLPFHRASFCLFQPIVGSDISNYLIKERLLDKHILNTIPCDYSKVSIPTKYIKNIRKIKELQSKAIISFYLRPKILFKLICENISVSQIKQLVKIFLKYVLAR